MTSDCSLISVYLPVLPVFAWCAQKVVLIWSAEEFNEHMMQKLVKTVKNTEIKKKKSNVKFCLELSHIYKAVLKFNYHAELLLFLIFIFLLFVMLLFLYFQWNHWWWIWWRRCYSPTKSFSCSKLKHGIKLKTITFEASG